MVWLVAVASIRTVAGHGGSDPIESCALDRNGTARAFYLYGWRIALGPRFSAAFLSLCYDFFGAPDGFIDDLFVRPEFRRRGVASSLLSALFEQCRQDGVAALHVEVGEDNAAAGALYREFGLAANGRRLLTAEIG